MDEAAFVAEPTEPMDLGAADNEAALGTHPYRFPTIPPYLKQDFCNSQRSKFLGVSDKEPCFAFLDKEYNCSTTLVFIIFSIKSSNS